MVDAHLDKLGTKVISEGRIGFRDFLGNALADSAAGAAASRIQPEASSQSHTRVAERMAYTHYTRRYTQSWWRGFVFRVVDSGKNGYSHSV